MRTVQDTWQGFNRLSGLKQINNIALHCTGGFGSSQGRQKWIVLSELVCYFGELVQEQYSQWAHCKNCRSTGGLLGNSEGGADAPCAGEFGHLSVSVFPTPAPMIGTTQKLPFCF